MTTTIVQTTSDDPQKKMDYMFTITLNQQQQPKIVYWSLVNVNREMRLQHELRNIDNQTESESESDRYHFVFATLQFNQPVPEDRMQYLNDTTTFIETEL